MTSVISDSEAQSAKQGLVAHCIKWANSKMSEWTLRHLPTPYRSEEAAQPTYFKSDSSLKFYFPELLLKISSQGGGKKKKSHKEKKKAEMKQKNPTQKTPVLPSLEKSIIIHQITTLSKGTLSCPWTPPTYSHDSSHPHTEATTR